MLYCLLDFFQNVSSLMSLCMSSYGLAYSIGHPWLWNNVLIVSCISTTIICSAVRQAIDKTFLEKYIERKESLQRCHETTIQPIRQQDHLPIV